MDFFLSTNWNSRRHTDGEALVDEILSLGFSGIEVGYDFRSELTPGLLRRIRAGAVQAASVHAFSPVPLGAPAGHPELFLLAATEEDTRRLAIFHLRRTLDFAGEIGARAIVVHAGRVRLGRCWARHADWHDREMTDGWRYRWNLKRMTSLRRRRIQRHLDALCRSLEELLPQFEQADMLLAIENLPSFDALPDRAELLQLIRSMPATRLRGWLDLGHEQIMANLGFGTDPALTRQLVPVTAGVHIHDVRGTQQDHLAPGTGGIAFSDFGFLAGNGIIPVFEPAPTVTSSDLKAGLRLMRQCWGTPDSLTKGTHPL